MFSKASGEDRDQLCPPLPLPPKRQRYDVMAADLGFSSNAERKASRR
jgi:hypothetical protein